MTMTAYFDDGLKEGKNNTVDEAVECSQEGGQQQVCGILCLILVLVGVVSVYALYSCIEFLSDQIDNLDTNTTLIETYKGTRGRHVSSLTDTFTEIAGNDRLMWLIPVNSYMPPAMTESIYERYDMFDTHPLLQYDDDTIVNDTTHLLEDGDDDASPELRKRHN
ncbi:hypothetical protein FOZ63_029354 [Perkinsus olseni]|uniref:Uncharacterized protein n=1 Tax=Perkinsus olseni TaxID=32597 RepID=A0A7J6U5U7_PEROL|nr:hypothetical protein FOZ63_029354 [Perkinsus olseni]KAF4752755.1 hypothetical protein FOZ62_028570 [Perkinsus olseni]